MLSSPVSAALGPPSSVERVLQATTVRAIAQRAGVDPSLVIQHYGSKADLYTSAIQLDGGDSTDRDRHLDDVLEKRLGKLPPETRALVRSMLTSPEAAASMKAYLDERVANLARSDDGPDAELRAALTVSSILGLTIARHFLALSALVDISEEQVEAVVRPGSPPPAARSAETPRRSGRTARDDSGHRLTIALTCLAAPAPAELCCGTATVL